MNATGGWDVEAAVETVGLTKRYGDLTAVDRVDLAVAPGTIYGLMGHNGAGKTTLIRALLGLTRPSAGTGRVLGLDIVNDTIEIRRQCGFLPADLRLPGDTTPRRFLRYVAAMFGESGASVDARIDELVDIFHLEAFVDRRLAECSTGMVQKIGLAQALINRPRVLMLDEPTAGSDPIGRHEILTLLERLASEQGVTILFCTHILTDIESVCAEAAVLHEGHLIASGPIDDMKRLHGCDRMDDLYLKLVREHAT